MIILKKKDGSIYCLRHFCWKFLTGNSDEEISNEEISNEENSNEEN